jgi:hypothetical protein
MRTAATVMVFEVFARSAVLRLFPAPTRNSPVVPV